MSNTTQPYTPPPCTQCGGQQVLVPCDPRMSLTPGFLSSVSLEALACTVCGFVTLYANDTEKLRKLLEK